MFAVVLAGLGAVVARIRCVDAAGEAARRASRDDVAGARDLAVGLPTGTEVTVAVEGDVVRVRVAMPPLGGALRGLRVTAEAVAAREPSVAGPTGAPDGGSTEGPSDPVGDDAVGTGAGNGAGVDGEPSAPADPTAVPVPSRPVGVPEDVPP